jgi:hypothetical protein
MGRTGPQRLLCFTFVCTADTSHTAREYFIPLAKTENGLVKMSLVPAAGLQMEKTAFSHGGWTEVQVHLRAHNR